MGNNTDCLRLPRRAILILTGCEGNAVGIRQRDTESPGQVKAGHAARTLKIIPEPPPEPHRVRSRRGRGRHPLQHGRGVWLRPTE